MGLLDALKTLIEDTSESKKPKQTNKNKSSDSTAKSNKAELDKVKKDAYTPNGIDPSVSEPQWVLADEEDGTHELMKNLTWARNQLGKEILESFLEYNERNIKGGHEYHNLLEEEFDSNQDLSLKYDNEAYFEEEKNYQENQVGSTNYIDNDKSIGDLILEWMKTGHFNGSFDLGSFGMDFSGGVIGNWDLGKSINHLISASHEKSTHRCAKYVREAIEAGGLSLAGHPENAIEYVRFLPTIGFKHIKTIKYDPPYKTYMREAMPGDIAIMPNPKGGPGHICMYTGKQWISDFRQSRAWVYGGQCGLLYIFRYISIIQGIKMGNLSAGASGISQEMFNAICHFETGHNYGYQMTAKDLNGYGNDQGHKTYGYGLLRHPNGKYMDQVKSRWTQRELEALYVTHVQQFSSKVRNWASKKGLQLAQNQIDAITSAVFNYGPGFLTMPKYKVCQMIANHAPMQNVWVTWSTLSDRSSLGGLKKRRRWEANWYIGKKTPLP